MAPDNSPSSPSAMVPRNPSLPCLMRSTGDSLFSSAINIFNELVNVFEITILLFQLFQESLRSGGSDFAFLHQDQDQGIFHIHAHWFLSTANKYRGAFFDPFVKIPAVLQHAVLHINFLSLVSRECGIDPCQQTRFGPVLQLGLV